MSKLTNDHQVGPNQSATVAALRHSAAHLLAHAVMELFPNTKLTIGPVTQEGFFYDFLPTTNFKEEDLIAITKRMHEIVARNLPLVQKEITKDEARKLFNDNQFKLELIDKIPDELVGISSQGNFYDLCRGGHVATTGEIKHFALQAISGSYWRANKDGQALQRISGTAFPTEEELKSYLQRLEDLKEYDHRRLGKQLDLFSFHEEGVGFPFFHPKGQRVLHVMETYMRGLQGTSNYQEISTPTMLSDELWRRSGHYAHYKDKMYFCNVDEVPYAIKPMNCPGAILTYATRPRSYRELPLKLAEYGHVHRHELSGVLHGLLRVRAFTQDDVHVFCTIEQVQQEITTIVQLMFTMLKKFGFANYFFAVSTRPENSLGSDEYWEKATNDLKESLNSLNVPFSIQEGEGAFYGPKIELGIEDSMGRRWQCGTVQVDFFLPENFDLTYVAPSGKRERPVMLHSVIYGSLERFFAILLEHYKGHLPFWLAPTQIRILTITDDQNPYAQTLLEALKTAGIRAEVDLSSDPLSGQIKTAQLEKIPWMLIVGKKEVANNTVTLRYVDGTQEANLTLPALLEKAAAANR